MSTFARVEVDCPGCARRVSGTVAAVVNLERHPASRDAILNGRFNQVECAHCGRRTSVMRTVALVHIPNRWWLRSYPAWCVRHWKDLAHATELSLHWCLGASTPEWLQGELGPPDAWTCRVLFGVDAVRDKLVTWEAGLSEVAVELAKLRLAATPLAASADQVLLHAADAQGLEWLVRTGDTVERVRTDRSVLDIEVGSAMTRAALGSDPFVSYLRFLHTPVGADPLMFDLEGRTLPDRSPFRRAGLG